MQPTTSEKEFLLRLGIHHCEQRESIVCVLVAAEVYQ